MPFLKKNATDLSCWQRLSCLFGVLLCAVILIWIAGFAWFTLQIKSFQNKKAPVAEAIVVLTGGSNRVQTGVDLLLEGNNQELFVSGVGKKVSMFDLLQNREVIENYSDCCISLGHVATNTRENALETKQWVHEKGYHSLWLVTAHYHMPRSLAEFRDIMPDITIVPHAVIPELFRKKGWIPQMEKIIVMFNEYHKYIWAFIRIRVVRFIEIF